MTDIKAGKQSKPTDHSLFSISSCFLPTEAATERALAIVAGLSRFVEFLNPLVG